MRDRLYSRETLAGHRPELLRDATVLVVGAGATGSNVLQTLRLQAIGTMLIADPQDFEPTNATRSPLYPTSAEAKRWGMGKAEVSARKLLELHGAEGFRAGWFRGPIQAAAGLVGAVDVVVSCVDNNAARAWLADATRACGTPFVETGFLGAAGSVSAYVNRDAGEPCWRDLRYRLEDQVSCADAARLLGDQGLIPAVQTGAAMVAAVAAEQVLMLAQGSAAPLAGSIWTSNVRTGESLSARLPSLPHCPGLHAPTEEVAFEVAPDEPLRNLFREIDARWGWSELPLSLSFIRALDCPGCGAEIVRDLPWWDCNFRSHRCERLERDPGPLALRRLDRLTPEDESMLDLSCRRLGFTEGAAVQVLTSQGAKIARMAGDPKLALTWADSRHAKAGALVGRGE